MTMQSQAPWSQWNGSDLPLANCSRLRSGDIDQVRAHMIAMFCPHDLYTEGGNPPISFRHNHAALRSLSFHATDYGHSDGRVVIAVPPMPDIFVVEIALAGQAQVFDGRSSLTLRAGDLFVMGGDHPFRHEFDAGFRNFSLKVVRAKLEALLTTELGFTSGQLHFSSRTVRIEGAADSFARTINAVCDDIDEGNGGYDHPRVAATAEDLLQRLLLATVPHNHSEAFNTRGKAPAPFHVRRAEEYVHANFDKAISLRELIAAAGVSGRSLHVGFRRFRNTTPMGYVRDYRLSLARSALEQAVPGDGTVTEVALHCGFTHLSRFAHDYFLRYGEHPSATLRRKR